MTSVFTARRRAEEFARAVDGGAVPTAEELADLVGVVTSLRELPPPEPGREFVDDLRSRLMAEAATVLRPENAHLALPTRPRGARERRLVAAASVLAVVGGTAGMATAAQGALPGEALYPVKRGIERAEAGLSLSSSAKGRALLDQARDRLEETRGLLVSDSPAAAPAVPATLEDFTSAAREGSDLLLGSFQETRDPDAVATVRTFAAQSLATLTRLAATAPEDSQDELDTAALALREIDQRAVDLCQSCADGLPELDLPKIFLLHAEADRALHDARAGDLDNSHPVVVDSQAVEQARQQAQQAARQQDGTRVETPSAPRESTSPQAPDPTASPTDQLSPDPLPSLPLPGTGDTTGDGASDGSGTAGGLLDGAETLLPDTGDLLR
jgi:hypothetical protein